MLHVIGATEGEKKKQGETTQKEYDKGEKWCLNWMEDGTIL